ncbi:MULTISPECIES: F0F1 ATP synthase subunit gamma [Lacticaseibacillus]|jgi:F-type H+-transporting ATPase subunit gamma|uniref:ATP synthase gamma chain n=6 Tax=Lacticaseibacillus TaxID=2759736 RepID=A0AAN1C7R9_LACCA|nr:MULTISPECIES: F0F1 ATP synthase subunit gamma [Lacticaseibacillus]ARY91282.1 F0F1 ATP synthase subunit gamma [Lacticaseibacillus casei]KAB1968403.1 F0F1 ATP synthase subunit gamma [Lacticaseibacillus casei]KLI76252.1 ATP synthase F0F1 subunit gamma [Lacticaseibacillus casei]MDE3282162.1 F0F1 ATP synthase subunit gamma [Lacticaseibacillus casei]MDG3061896.1 F0F1 ATP synthase subunit gamma [Lacticaseibacillus sp. BCRC 81376]
MAESLMDIKRKIASTKKTGQITQAMQMVSGAKLSQIEKRARKYQLYADKVRQIVTHLAAGQLLELANAANNDAEANKNQLVSVASLLEKRPVKKTGYLVITSDRGLVGSYNSTVLKAMMQMIKDDHEGPDDYVMMAIGGVGADFFKARGLNLAYEYRGVSDIPTFNEVREIVKTAVTMYDNGVFDELYVCYNHHVNTLTSAFRAEKMLPISDLDVSEVEDTNVEYLVEPDLDAVLDAVLPQYAESLIFGAIMDAKTAEHAASTTAMRSATDNANDLISHLSTQFNRARQAAITTEITEIVGGAAALE